MSRDPSGTPLLAGLLALGSILAQVAAQSPFELVPGRLEPLVDRALFAQLEGVEHRLHEPRPAGVALRFERPWEGGLSGYCTVLRDADRWLLYYRGRPVVGRARDATAEAREVTCVAVSDDGRSWSRPAVDAEGRNVILEEPPEVCHNFAPFVDAREGVPPSHRFKALGGTQASGLLAWHSADGLHWQRTRDEPVITDGAFDSQNVAFWSPSENCYVCYLRVFLDRVRWIARSTSADFLHWSAPEPITADGPREHLYTNQATPYVRAPHLYLATPARFWPGRRALSPAQQLAIGLDQPDRYPGLAAGTSDAVLMSSRDGRHFDRPFLSSWIRPGPDLRNWVARANYPAHGIHETAAGELSLWIQRAYGQPSAHLERMTLRTDGFASLHAGAAGGTALSVPVRFGAPQRPSSDRGALAADELLLEEAQVFDLDDTAELGAAFTLAVRVKDVPPGRRRLFSSYAGGPAKPGELVFDADLSGAGIVGSGPMRLMLNSRTVLAPAGVFDRPAPDGWRHLAAVWNQGVVRLYVDGEQVAAGGEPDASPVRLAHGGLRLAEDHPPTSLINEALLGRVRDVVITREALDDAAIRELATTTLDALPPMRAPRSPSAARLRLALNVATSAAGEVRVGLEDLDGKPLAGHSLDDCDPIHGDDPQRIVTWRGDAELAGFAGRELRLRVVIRDADVFAVRLE